MYRDALAAGAIQIGNQQFIFSPRNGGKTYALTAKGGQLGYYVDDNSSEESEGYYDAEGRYVLARTLVVSQRFVATQQGSQAMFTEFVQFFFGRELKKVNAGKNIKWRIFDTNSDLLGVNGSTVQQKDGTILIRIGARAMADPKLLYHTVGHELIHASDYLNGNYDKWQAMLGAEYEWYGTDKVMGLIMEHHAYEWDAAMEIKFGTDYGARQRLEYYSSELHDLSIDGY